MPGLVYMPISSVVKISVSVRITPQAVQLPLHPVFSLQCILWYTVRRYRQVLPYPVTSIFMEGIYPGRHLIRKQVTVWMK